MSKKAECLVIIPAYNEEQNVGRVIKEIRSLNLDLDLVVIDDGSTDLTKFVVREKEEKLISLPFNIGYGGALQTGYKYAVSMDYNYVVQFDADGQHDSSDILLIIEQLTTGEYDIVIGSRFLGKSSFYTSIPKKLAIMFFRLLIKWSTGVPITDPTSGLQGLTKQVYTYYATMGNYPEDYPDTDTLISMILSGYRVTEIAAHIRERHSGKGMHSGIKTLYYFIKMLVSILIVLIRGKNKGGGALN